MIVYDKEQKEIVIPNGIGNINLYNNGVEAGYNQGYEQGQADMAAKARNIEVTKNGFYGSEFSDPIIPELVTGVYADGTDFYNYAELKGKVFNTKITATENSRLEFWYKGDNKVSGRQYNVIIGAGNRDDYNTFQVRYFVENNDILHINLGGDDILISEWDDTVWHHLIISKSEGIWIDGKKGKEYDSTIHYQIDGEFYINGISYDVNSDGGGTRTANGCFGMIKIDDVVIIPTADGFLDTNTGELLEIVQDGRYTFIKNEPIYSEGELIKTVYVNVPDLNGSYDEGYAQGKIDGANEQKGKLESINITENGTYNKEDGYNHIEVNVPDLNGSYDEGYTQGQADVAANARVLNVTENGNYLSKFSDPVAPTLVTGVYADGTGFYSYAELNGKVFNTKIAATKDSRIEFWWKNDATYNRYATIIGGQTEEGYIFKFAEYSTNTYRIEYGNATVGNLFYHNFNYDMTSRWNHIIFSKQDGLYVNDELICQVQGERWGENETIPNFWINAAYLGEIDNNANGTFGMIKINDVVIIPTANGFKNVNTGELLEVMRDGTYTFTENLPIYPEGELYKTINVNVIPKINLQKEGVKLQGSTFKEVPDWVDLEGVTSLNGVFSNCTNLLELPILNVPYCTDFDSVFLNIRFADLTNIQYWVYPKNAKWSQAFGQNYEIEKCPAIYMEGSNDYYQGFPFWGYSNYTKFTDFGGFIGLKYSITQDYSLPFLPNLTYESCINILNGLYDFSGNGETPNSDQGHLKVAQSFIDKVGDKISIGVAKGWVISA